MTQTSHETSRIGCATRAFPKISSCKHTAEFPEPVLQKEKSPYGEERDIMMMLDSSFTISLFQTFTGSGVFFKLTQMGSH